jgi:nitrite reductase/ring-hydroxylating ferredoxin subunit
MTEGYLKVGPLDLLKRRRCMVIAGENHSIAVFYHDGVIHAIHNRCSHSGYPLESGTIKGDIITCIWHQARFVLSNGCSLNPEIRDIPTFSVQIADGEVWVNPVPNAQSETGTRST